MQRRTNDQQLAKVWIERIVWNVAAATALAVMIAILLCSLRLLDEIDPQTGRARGAMLEPGKAEIDRSIEYRPTRVARIHATSGEWAGDESTRAGWRKTPVGPSDLGSD